MSWTKPRAGWEDQTFNSKDVFSGANKRIRPADELEEGERPVLDSGGLYDVANQIYIKLHEKRKKTEIETFQKRQSSDLEEFRQLSTETEIVDDKVPEPRNFQVLQAVASAVKPPAAQSNLLQGYSSSETEQSETEKSETEQSEKPAKRKPPPAKKLFAARRK